MVATDSGPVLLNLYKKLLNNTLNSRIHKRCELLGTVVNAIAVLIGGAVGLKMGQRISERFRHHILTGIGLFTLILGIRMALASNSLPTILISLIVGGMLGHAINIDHHLHCFSEWIAGDSETAEGSNSFSQSFVAASLVFCAGPLTVVGSILDGVTGDFQPLLMKSVLDGFTAMAMCASLGVGVIYSVATIIVFQGGISLGAMSLSFFIGNFSADSQPIIELGAVGGLLIFAIGLNILQIKDINVANFLPAIVIAPAISLAL